MHDHRIIVQFKVQPDSYDDEMLDNQALTSSSVLLPEEVLQPIIQD